jgi:hypothetical protein
MNKIKAVLLNEVKKINDRYSIACYKQDNLAVIDEPSVRYWIASILCEWYYATKYQTEKVIPEELIFITVEYGHNTKYYTCIKMSIAKLNGERNAVAFKADGNYYMIKPCDSTMKPIKEVPVLGNFKPVRLDMIQYKVISKSSTPIIYTGMTN